ncbi:MAG: FAD-dependent oxidoreductase [Chlamydiia bacterium]
MQYDLLIVGAGATGLYTAIDAASRGFKVCLVDQDLPGQKTSSNSSRLMHGGVRYLKQLRFGFVYEGLKERHYFLKNAPNFVYPIEMLTPTTSWIQTTINFIGLKIYQWLAGPYSLGPTKWLTKSEMLKKCPYIQSNNLVAGVSFFDAKFNDQELIHAMHATFLHHGGTFLMKKACLLKENEVCFTDDSKIQAKGIILALGPFTDLFLQNMHLESLSNPLLDTSRGIHLIVDKKFHPKEFALFNMDTTDGRVFFVIPDHEKVLLGTTDIKSTSLEPTEAEIEFVLLEASRLLKKGPTKKDILAVTSGLRPLSRRQKGGRDIDLVEVNRYTIAVFGGKWTSSRKTAETVVDDAIKKFDLPNRPCRTKNLKIQSNAL